MKLSVSYDLESDVLHISSGRPSDGATPMEEPELDLIAIYSAGADSRDVVGVEMIFAAGYLAPYFRLRRENAPPRAGNPELTRYDPATDILTWGVTTDAPGMVSQADDLIAYWQPDPEDETFFEAIGLSLRNAAKHLAPFFERVEPAGGRRVILGPSQPYPIGGEQI